MSTVKRRVQLALFVLVGTKHLQLLCQWGIMAEMSTVNLSWLMPLDHEVLASTLYQWFSGMEGFFRAEKRPLR